MSNVNLREPAIVYSQGNATVRRYPDATDGAYYRVEYTAANGMPRETPRINKWADVLVAVAFANTAAAKASHERGM